ncbi:thioredoxin domain-containing protein [Saccharicrinis sp. FJH54]|uniref:thioredoxin domain-containing protein n=1 Tax=Saccharicrinis sp. FJH54 TaxID=3344665 RepID=UPI0035D41F61
MHVHLHSNRLINESSPYLLQHAHNPVDWYPWGDEALEKARKENKMLIISIGYSACHWCHVMEHESFENKEVASFMNRHFVAVKVDREERPDIDHIYMSAVQLISGRGGWPLNVIALPDGRPVYGGTYFPRVQWLDMLQQLVDFAEKNPQKMEEYAENLTNGIIQSDIVNPVQHPESFSLEKLHTIFRNWKEHLDPAKGGMRGAPKFPMPVSYQFLMHYAFLTGNNEAHEAVNLTLNKMAMGGIYDQIGGGFARYSTDEDWKVPHFEKMLYDNGQLVSLYANAYQNVQDKEYKKVVEQTLGFVEQELMSHESGFYSALDADSEGVEGKYYVWTKQELDHLLGDIAPLVYRYYDITEHGNWENGLNVLHRLLPDKIVADEFGISVKALHRKIKKVNELLLDERENREKPGLDDKILTSWNALMCKGFIDAYRVFDDPHYLEVATRNLAFLLSKMKKQDYRLDRNYKEGKSTINGFLDDYAFLIDALISMYMATFNEFYIDEALAFTQYVIVHFYDDKGGMFYYTSDLDHKLIARNHEVTDNVIPSSNSAMAKNLFMLGHYFEKPAYIGMAQRMLTSVKEEMQRSGAYFANWCILKAWFVENPFEVAIAGTDAVGIRKEMDQYYLPHVLFCGGNGNSTLPLLKNRQVKGKTIIYVCKDKTCKQPVESVDEAMNMLNNVN